MFKDCPISRENKPKLMNDCNRGKQESGDYD